MTRRGWLRLMAAGVLVVWLCLFLHWDNTEKSMIRALLVETSGDSWTVGLLYQFPEASADSSEAEAAIRLCVGRGPQLSAAIAAAEKACAEAGVKALVGKIATGDLFVGDSETKAAIEAKCAPDCVEMEGAAVSQIAAKNGVPCVILRAMSDNADEDGHEVLVVKKFSIAEYVATATKIVAAMVEAL